MLTDARVYRILFDGKRAVGVELMRNGALEQIRAEREVILSAGAYHSPQLLMLSGVGPAEALAPLSIETFHELPVGQNLQDHVMLNFVCLTDKGSLISSITPEAIALFEAEGRGPMSSNGGEGGALRPHPRRPRRARRAVPLRRLLLHEEFLGVPFDDAYSFGPALVKPTSRGTVTLRSPLPHARPRILHNYLTTDEDRASMIDGVRLAFEISAAPALREWRRADFLVPGVRLRRGHHGLRPAPDAHRLPPGGHVRDGRGRRRRAARASASRACASSTPRSCRRSRAATPTPRRSWSPRRRADIIRGLPPLPREQASEEVAAA